MTKLHLKDAVGNVLLTINVARENRILTVSPRIHLDEIKNSNFILQWSSGLLGDIDFNDVKNIDIER